MRVQDIADAVRRVADGGSVIDPEVVARLLGRPRQHSPLDELTPRETEILGLMAEGRSNAGIAQALVLEPKTVEGHVSQIFGKLGLEREQRGQPTRPRGGRRICAGTDQVAVAHRLGGQVEVGVEPAAATAAGGTGRSQRASGAARRRARRARSGTGSDASGGGDDRAPRRRSADRPSTGPGTGSTDGAPREIRLRVERPQDRVARDAVIEAADERLEEGHPAGRVIQAAGRRDGGVGHGGEDSRDRARDGLRRYA